jgi:hypothetical protein
MTNDNHLWNLAEKVSICLIQTSVHTQEGLIAKDMIIKRPFDESLIKGLPKEWEEEKGYALGNIKGFNTILDTVLEKKLQWFNLEGFCEDNETYYRFYTKKEVQDMIDELYNA